MQKGQEEEVFYMAARTDLKEAETIDKLAVEAELLLDEDDTKKDLKEKRAFIKQTLYDGSNKLKHIVPKGKHL